MLLLAAEEGEQLDIFKDARLGKFLLLFKDVTCGSLTAGEEVCLAEPRLKTENVINITAN